MKSKHQNQLIPAVICFFLITLVLGSGNKSVLASPQTADTTPTPTTTPSRFKTVDSCKIESTLKPEWKISLCETFDDNSRNWLVGEQGSDVINADAKIEDGKYIIDFSGKAGKNYSTGVGSALYIGDVTDFVVTVKGKFDTDNKFVGWGFLYRSDQDRNGYAYRIFQEGKYGLQRMEGGKLFTLIPAKASNLIKKGADITLSIVAEGDHFDFYINDSLVNSYDDAKLNGKRLNLALYLQEGAKAVFEFDEILVKTP